MNIGLLTAITPEFNAAKKTLDLRHATGCAGCRMAQGLFPHDMHVFCILSGPGKIRSAQASTRLINAFPPDLLIDTGTCAGIRSGIGIGGIVIGTGCFEFDIGGKAIPAKAAKITELPAAFRFLKAEKADKLIRAACACGMEGGQTVFHGKVACGEIVIDSGEKRRKLANLFGAAFACWETAAVFICGLRCCIPTLSIRIVSDLGDLNAVADFRKNARRCLPFLYRFIRRLIEEGWIAGFMDEWRGLSPAVRNRLAASVPLFPGFAL